MFNQKEVNPLYIIYRRNTSFTTAAVWNFHVGALLICSYLVCIAFLIVAVSFSFGKSCNLKSFLIFSMRYLQSFNLHIYDTLLIENIQDLLQKIIKLFSPHKGNYVDKKGIYILEGILFRHIIYILSSGKYRHIIYFGGWLNGKISE